MAKKGARLRKSKKISNNMFILPKEEIVELIKIGFTHEMATAAII